MFSINTIQNMDTKTVIKQGRERLGLTEQQFADRVGVSRGAVQQWERGTTAPKRGNQAAVADLLGISKSELMGLQPAPVIGAGEAVRNVLAYIDGDEPTSNVIRIKQYETGGAMGNGVVLRDQPGVIRSWSVTEEWLQKNARSYTSPANLALVTGFGDSMRGLYEPGDPLLVDTGVNTVDFDGVYFFRVGDEGFIKRLQRIPGEGIIAISENKAYRDWTIRKEMDFQVFGRVVKAWLGTEY